MFRITVSLQYLSIIHPLGLCFKIEKFCTVRESMIVCEYDGVCENRTVSESMIVSERV